MTNKTRKRLWPVSLVMAVAIVGVMAAFLMVASSPTNTQAHDGASGSTHCDDIPAGLLQDVHDATYDHDCATGPAATPTPVPNTPAPPPTATPTPDPYLNAPSAPTMVRSEALDNSILVRWNKPDSVGPAGAEIVAYEITRTAYTSDANSPINMNGGKTIKVGAMVREYRDQGLGYNTTYSHTVRAINKFSIGGVMHSKVGPDSAPVTSATATSGGYLLPEEAPPGMPDPVTVKHQCADSITVMWEEPKNKGKVAPDTVGCPVCANQTPPHVGGTNAGIMVKPGTAMIVSYMVERRVNGGDWVVLSKDVDAADLYYSDTSGLAFGSMYDYRVTAMNNAGLYGEPSKIMGVDIDEPIAPQIPTSPDADPSPDNPNHVLVTWDPPGTSSGTADWRVVSDVDTADNNTSRSMSYIVQRQAAGSNQWVTLVSDQKHQYLEGVSAADAIANVQTQRFVDTKAAAGAYKYRVAAQIEVCAQSEWVVTAEEVRIGLGDASGLTVTASAQPGVVNLSWIPGANANIHWVAGIAVMADGGYDYGDTVWSAASGNTSHMVTGLTSGTTYVFTVISGQVVGSSEDWGNWTPTERVTAN